MKRYVFAAALALLACALPLATASAATMRYLDIPAMTLASDLVVRGHVLDSSVFVDEAYGRISTRWSIAVETGYKGGGEGIVSFVQWGGELDGIVEYIPGDARFELGEEVIVFLRQGEDNALHLTALSQSKITVVSDTPGNTVANAIPVADAVMQPLQVVAPGETGVRDLRGAAFYHETGDGSAEIISIPFEMQSISAIEAAIRLAAQEAR
jgi:hypothetical protein